MSRFFLYRRHTTAWLLLLHFTADSVEIILGKKTALRILVANTNLPQLQFGSHRSILPQELALPG